MRRQEEFVLRLSPMQIFAIGQMPVGERGVDHRFIDAVRQRGEPVMRHAEAPAFGVIGRAIGDQIGLVGQRVNVRLQLGERQPRAHRRAVIQHMQRMGLEIDDALARPRS